MLNFSSRKCSKNERLSKSPISGTQYALALIVVFAAILRIWKLGEWSLWIDEVQTIFHAQQLSFDNLVINPLPYLAVKLSLSAWGADEWRARLIPCIVGIASIPLIFLMGRSLINTRVGIFAAGFVALSNWHLFWSQNSRGYIFTFLFGTLTAWSFYLAIQHDRPSMMIGSLFSAICLILSHTLSIFILPALAGYAASFWLVDVFPHARGVFVQTLEEHHSPVPSGQDDTGRPAGLRWRNLLIFFAPFTISLFLFILPEFRTYLFSGWGLNEWQRSPIYIIFTLVYGLSVPVAVTALFSLFAKPLEHSVRFLVCYAGIPLVLYLIASRLQNVAGYYLFFTAPAYFLLGAIGCERIWGVKSLPLAVRAILPCVIIVTMLSQNYLYFNIENGGRPKWREAFSTIRSGMNDNDRVVVSLPQISQHYLPELKPTAIKEVLEKKMEFEEKWVSKGVRVWFVIDAGSFNVFDSGGDFRQWVRQRARLVQTFSVFARAKDRTINLYLWDTTE